MATLAVLNHQGKKVDEIPLNEKIFTDQVNTAVMHQAVLMYHSNTRQGNASTLERGSVSGGGKKPWRQKGTGRARQGSTRSPLWVHGGVVFGPHPRDFGYALPQKIRAAALRESVISKLKTKNLFCIEDLKDKVTKTKEFSKVLSATKIQGSVLALLDGCDASVVKASRNLPRFDVMRAEDVSAYDVLSRKVLLLTKTAFNKLVKRIGQ